MRRIPSLVFLFWLALVAMAAGEGRAGGKPAGESGDGVRVTYLANEGFLFEAGETAVLVDALFGDGLAEYPVVPQPTRGDLEAARGRFAGIDLILVSHAHADHFSAEAVARHLRANPAAAFLSTPEAVAALKEALGEEARGHDLIAAAPARGKTVRLERQGVTVAALELHHGRVPIENLAFVVSLGGVELLHVGDTSADASDLHPYAEPLAAVDVWLLPDWLMGEPDWEAARARAAGPTLLVDMHLAAPSAPPAWFGSAGTYAGRVTRIREALPDAWVPLEHLASRQYPAP